MILVPEKELVNKSEEFLRNLKDSLPPLLDAIHKKISIGNVIRPPIGVSYFFIYLPQSIQADLIAIAEIEQSIINFGGKFTMGTPFLKNVDAIKVSLALKDVSEFRFKKTRNKYETITKNNTEIMKVNIKDFQTLREQIKKFLKMLQLNEDHYSQIIPEVDLNVEHGPVFFKEKAYADYVIAQANHYKKIDGYVFARVGETKNLYFKIGFTNPLTEEQPLPHGFTIVSASTIPAKAEVPSTQSVKVEEKNTTLEKGTDTAEDKFLQLKLLLKTWGFVSGKDYSTFIMNPSKTFAAINGVVDRRQNMIDVFTKHNLFNCLELKEGIKSIRIDLAIFKNPILAPDKNDAKVTAKSVVKKSPVKESLKINSEDKLADLRAFIHASGIICGKHYAAITLNATKTIASINGVHANGPLRSELIDKFDKYGLLDCLNTTSTEKSIKVNLELFKKLTIVKSESKQSQEEKTIIAKGDKKLFSKVFTPKLLENTLNSLLEVTKELSTITKVLQGSIESKPQDLSEITDQLVSITKSLNSSAEAKWEMFGKKYAGQSAFKLIVSVDVDGGGTLLKPVTKEEFIELFS